MHWLDSAWLHPLHGPSADHVGIAFAAFRYADHEPGQAVTADFIKAKTKLKARHSECATQPYERAVIQNLGKHAIPLPKVELERKRSLKVDGLVLN